ncbi:MAG: VWA domain-containing protein [Terracidiphilus sp.]|nr:VWA domain-containing protein [Terracidiphilus sp.]
MRPLSMDTSALVRGLGLLALACLSTALPAPAQTGPPQAQQSSFTLAVPVDEVGLTFHAADAHGLPVNDLKLDELTLLDNGKAPHRILDFYLLQDHPIRAAILIDTSVSMQPALKDSKAIALEYAEKVLRQKTDEAQVIEFGYSVRAVQGWTSNPSALAAGIAAVQAGRDNPVAGTAIFNTLYRVCSSEFGAVDPATRGNFILLFSDGEDNAGQSTLENVVTACQHTNTAIYAFRAEPANGLISSGPKTLSAMASQTGGRVFAASATDGEIDADLRTIEVDLRNQYRLVYKPAEWRHDGSFHRVQLKAPQRVDSITVRSGYYAPVR